jgi:hypothetical protein
MHETESVLNTPNLAPFPSPCVTDDDLHHHHHHNEDSLFDEITHDDHHHHEASLFDDHNKQEQPTAAAEDDSSFDDTIDLEWMEQAEMKLDAESGMDINERMARSAVRWCLRTCPKLDGFECDQVLGFGSNGVGKCLLL